MPPLASFLCESVLGLSLFPSPAHAETLAGGDAAPPGSTAFCLFEIPQEGERRLWLNLGIVQYVELRADELRVYYGGGNLGSGHEFRLRAGRKEGEAFIRRMQEAAASCAAPAVPASPPPADTPNPGCSAPDKSEGERPAGKNCPGCC